MNWKKRIAKEWIWLVGTVAGGSLAWGILGELRENTVGILIVLIGLVYFIRLTIWAIKELGTGKRTLSKKEKTKE